jgi:hypothetical protein
VKAFGYEILLLGSDYESHAVLRIVQPKNR